MESYRIFMIGQPTLDKNTDYDGTVTRAPGGAVLYSGWAAAALGHRVAILAKTGGDIDLGEAFGSAQNVQVYALHSPQSTIIENTYFTADRERRTALVRSRIMPYRVADIPPVDAAVWQLGGLMAGDIGAEVLEYAAENAPVALDVQGFIRCEENGEMVFHDWGDKRTLLPKVHFLKTDAAEAEILTGLTDRLAAAKQLYAWGAREIMITHSSEVLLYGEGEACTRPLKPRGLAGRTGRGDTCFASYIAERSAGRSMQEALQTAAALVSLKMETPGPFRGDRQDVEDFQREYYT